MRCSQAEHLLSLNLDGRLASGQRRALSEHLAECTRCRTLDHELEGARELALSLPVQRVGPGFREELWQRIRAGEGTPEAVFREPIPLATKVRYFATGAAAAGLLIVAAHLLRPQPASAPPQSSHPRAEDTVAAAAPRHHTLDPRGPVAIEPATPAHLATLVADGYTDAVRTLQARAQDLVGRQVPAETLEHLRQQVDRAGRFAGLLRWLVDWDYLRLPDEDAKNVAAIEVLGDQVRDFRDADSLRLVLRPLRTLRLDQPRSYFCSPCVKDEPGFYREFLDRLRCSELEGALRGKIQVLMEPPGPVGARRVQVLVVR